MPWIWTRSNRSCAVLARKVLCPYCLFTNSVMVELFVPFSGALL
jgi:hypothetical protein